MKRSSAPLAILLLLVTGLACSKLRPRSALKWQVTLQVESSTGVDVAVNQTISVIERRLDAAAVRSFTIAPEKPGSNRIIVKLPDVPDRERIRGLLISVGKLELFHILSLPSPAPRQTYDTKEEADAFAKTLVPGGSRVLPYNERDTNAGANSPKWLVVQLPPVIDGSELRDAEAIPDRTGDADNYQIVFDLNKTGAEKFGAWTGAHINEYIAVTLNNEVKSAPYIRSQIFDRGEITGRYSRQNAEDLALTLRSGALPAPVTIVAEQSIK